MKRIVDIIQLTAVCAAVLALAVGFWLLPDRDFSDKENRSLEQFPSFTMDRDNSGSWRYTADIGKYFADQFPLRDNFVALKAYSELSLVRLENNGVIKADGCVLVPRPTADEELLRRNIRSISVFAQAIDAPVSVACLPRPCDVYAQKLPATYNTADDARIWDIYNEACADGSFTVCDMYTDLCGSDKYYRTDHHYTTDGAYSVYVMLADVLGYEPYPLEHFTREVVSRDFKGTSMRTSGFYFTESDEIVLYRYPGDGEYTVTADGKEAGLYDFGKLEGTDEYAVFLGGNHSRVDIVKENGEGRQHLLLIRDSYADALAPFLAMHFDLTMVDLRYYKKSVQSECDCDAALVLMSMAELSDGVTLGYLEMP